MTKKTSIVLLCLITVVVLFFGIFAFILDGQAVGIKDYNNAYALIQKSGMFGDTINATYQIKLEDDAEAANVIKTLKTRLQKAYAYYSVDITEDDGVIAINLATPTQTKVVNNESPTLTDGRVSTNITRNGKVEILSSQVSGQWPTYSKDTVVLSNEHLRNATTRNYANGDYTYYICQAKLTKEGEELVKKAKLVDGATYGFAIDESTTNHYAVYTNGQFQLYNSSKVESKALASYINDGALDATLTFIESNEVANGTGWIFAAVMGVIVLATFVFFAVRYKVLGLAGILSQLIATVIFVYALAIYMSMLNLYAAIALVVAYAFMTAFTTITFERIRARMTEKTFATSAYQGFRSTNILSLIAHGALLVVGIILWVIPTAVTAPMGTIFVYGAVLSFAATFGLNRLFVKFVEPFYETSGKTIAKK